MTTEKRAAKQARRKEVIPFLNKRLSLAKNPFGVAQFIAPLTCGNFL